jgi:hypothetical protein
MSLPYLIQIRLILLAWGFHGDEDTGHGPPGSGRITHQYTASEN